MLREIILVGMLLATVHGAGKAVSNECLTAFRSSILTAHNGYRRQHKAPALTQDTTISATAQKYATYLADNTLFQHSHAQGLGENLAMSGAFNAPTTAQCSAFGTQFANMWYDEVKNYNYNNPVFGMNTGHFTQVVWKSSTKLGCGLGVASNNNVYGVCNYSPPGNVQGLFAQNVLPKA